MYKVIAGAALGIFVGAFAMELLSKVRPGAFKGIGDGVGKIASSLSQAFKSGYQGVAKPE